MDDTNTEIFRPIPGFPSYEASNKGRVRKIGRETCIAASPIAGKRYLAVALTENGVTRMEYLHRAVWSSVHGPIPAGMVIHHVSGCAYDNKIKNLSCVTQAENMRRSHLDGTAHCLAQESQPEQQGKRGLFSAQQVRCLRRAKASGEHGAVSRLAREYGVGYSAAYAAAAGLSYGWVKSTSLETEMVRAEAIARREARKSAARVQRAASARAANTHTSNPPATIVGAL